MARYPFSGREGQFVNGAWVDGFRATVDISAVYDVLESIAQFTSDTRKPIEQALYVQMEEVRANFAAEGRPAWAQLRPRTVARRGSAHPILIDGGDFYRSVSRRNAKDNIFRVTRQAGEFGSRNKVAKFHQEGTKFMAARPWATVSEEGLAAIEEVFRAYLFDAIAGALS